MELISNEYARMRSKQTKRNFRSLRDPLRQLFAWVRTANVKARLSTSVEQEVQDVTVAVELVNYVLYHDISSSAPAVANDENLPNANIKRKREGDDGAAEDDDESPTPPAAPAASRAQSVRSSYLLVSELIAELYMRGETSVDMSLILQQVNENRDHGVEALSQAELNTILGRLERENKVR